METKKYYWFIYHKGELIIRENDGKFSIPHHEQPPIPISDNEKIHEIGTIGSSTCRTIELAAPIKINNYPQFKLITLRESYNILSWDEYYTAGKAAQILHWDRTSKFCPTCGTPTAQVAPIAKKCPKCNIEYYPRISPAAIVLIKRNDSILLVHARSYRGTQNGLVAGFMEVGETIEACVHREVFEETGLQITNLRYYGNQPWPYPSGLMIGFIADYAGGEIKLQDEELTAGAFYTRENMPEIPPKLSIARQMIDAWIEGRV